MGITLCYLQMKIAACLQRMGNNNSLLRPHAFQVENTFPHLKKNGRDRSLNTSLHLCNSLTLHIFENQLYEDCGDVLQLFSWMSHHAL